MSIEKFRKRLSANDVGTTGGHQGGVLIPKGESELLAMLPFLDPDVKNPDAWIECVDDTGHRLKFRFVYYNNRLHDPREGDEFEISRAGVGNQYAIGIRPKDAEEVDTDQGIRIRLTGWRRVH